MSMGDISIDDNECKDLGNVYEGFKTNKKNRLSVLFKKTKLMTISKKIFQ